ncbi:MAG: hypothetical protein IPO06_04220 [Leptospiraceae bacterium]|nr:hypothetical protein [Leptospiraceae bacterium]
MQLDLEQFIFRKNLEPSDLNYAKLFLLGLYGNDNDAVCQLCKKSLKIENLEIKRILKSNISDTYYECNILCCNDCKKDFDKSLDKDLLYSLLFLETDELKIVNPKRTISISHIHVKHRYRLRNICLSNYSNEIRKKINDGSIQKFIKNNPQYTNLKVLLITPLIFDLLSLLLDNSIYIKSSGKDLLDEIIKYFIEPNDFFPEDENHYKARGFLEDVYLSLAFIDYLVKTSFIHEDVISSLWNFLLSNESSYKKHIQSLKANNIILLSQKITKMRNELLIMDSLYSKLRTKFTFLP